MPFKRREKDFIKIKVEFLSKEHEIMIKFPDYCIAIHPVIENRTTEKTQFYIDKNGIRYTVTANNDHDIWIYKQEIRVVMFYSDWKTQYQMTKQEYLDRQEQYAKNIKSQYKNGTDSLQDLKEELEGGWISQEQYDEIVNAND